MAQMVAPSGTAALHQAMLPAVAWVGRWLPVFLVPVQVMLPTINFPGPFFFLMKKGWYEFIGTLPSLQLT